MLRLCPVVRSICFESRLTSAFCSSSCFLWELVSCQKGNEGLITVLLRSRMHLRSSRSSYSYRTGTEVSTLLTNPFFLCASTLSRSRSTESDLPLAIRHHRHLSLDHPICCCWPVARSALSSFTTLSLTTNISLTHTTWANQLLSQPTKTKKNEGSTIKC